jgi:hypothetical protein
MAVPLVIPNALLVKINWTMGTRQWMNTMVLRATAAMPTIDQTFANNLFTDWSTAVTNQGLLPLLSATASCPNLSVRDISAANRPEFVSSGTALVGTGTGDPLPLSAAAVVTLRTAQAGKSFRGRIYFGGFTEAQNDASGRQAAAVNTATKNTVDQFNGSIAARGVQLAVGSRPAEAKTIPAKTTPARAGQANPVTVTLARNTKWESQRRRLGRT